MGSPFRIRISKLEPLNFLSCLIKSMLAMAIPVLFSWIPLFKRKYDLSIDEEEEEEDTDESRPSPALVQLPVHFIIGSIKDQLPIMKYGSLIEEGGSGSPSCAVCLSSLSASDEIRKLCNCSHIFHRDCLDGWVDQGQLTCPLCRSNLLPDQIHGKLKSNCQDDPWRRERMIYLFGEDFVFSNS
ncbi:hypothetical protein ACSBR2_008620 [Camellia fascicularis]